MRAENAIDTKEKKTKITIADSLKAVRRSVAVRSLLKPYPEFAPEHHWEGEFKITIARNPGFAFKVKAMIGFHNGLMEGRGNSLNSPYEQMLESDLDFTLSGTRSDDVVSFQIWFVAAKWRNAPFNVTGTIGADEREMHGDWLTPCMEPVTCQCSGVGGPFWMKRID